MTWEEWRDEVAEILDCDPDSIDDQMHSLLYDGHLSPKEAADMIVQGIFPTPTDKW